MYQIFLITFIMSFVIASLLSYMFNIKSSEEHVYLYLILITIIGTSLGMQYKYGSLEEKMDEYIKNLIIFSIIFSCMLLLLKLFVYLYQIGFNNITSYFIIALILLLVFISFCIYRINVLL